MAVASGIGTQLIYKPETTFGVVPAALSTNEALEIRSETLEMVKTTVQGQGLHAGGLYDRAKRRVLTNYDVNGGFVMDLQTRFIGNLIQAMVGSYGYAGATPTQIGVTGIYKSVHWPTSPGLQGHSLCFQKGVSTVDGGVVEPLTYVGVKLTDWEVAVSTGALAQLTINIDGRNELAGAGNSDPLNGSVPPLATFNTVPGTGLGLSEFHFRQATIFTGGTPTVASGVVSLVGATAAANVQSASVKQAVSLDTGRYFLGSAGFKAEQLENGFRSITGQLMVDWLSSEAMYNAFAADTTTSLQITLTGATVSTSNYLFDIIVPNIKLDGESPKVAGPQLVSQTVAFTGLDDEATTPIQVTYQTEDTTL
jgi:hypothetical protein